METEPKTLDAIQNEAKNSSISLEEVTANASGDTSTQDSSQNGTTKTTETSVKAAVEKILNKPRNTDASLTPEGDEQPDDEQTDGSEGGEEDSSASSAQGKEGKETKEKDSADATDEVSGDKEAATDDEAGDDGDEAEDGEDGEDGEEGKTATDDKGTTGKDAKNVPDEKLPFHKHPRFQQLIHENSSLKPKAAELDNIVKYRTDNQIDDDTFNQALTLAALSKKDPQGFVKTLRTLCDDQEVQLGLKLPSDLAKRVEDGHISEADAKEISKLRIEKSQREQSEKQQTTRSEQKRVADVTSALNTIGSDLAKKDPTFRPKAKDSPDGVWEFALRSFTLLQASTPAKTGMEAAQQFTQCYNEVKQLITANTPRRPANKNFVSASNRNSRASGLTRSSRGKNGDGNDSVTGAVNDVLKKHGIKIRSSAESSGAE